MDISTLISTLNLDPHCTIEPGAGNYYVVRDRHGIAQFKVRPGTLNGKLHVEPWSLF